MAVTKEIDTPFGSYSITTLFAFLVAAGCIAAVASSRISLYLRRRKVKQEYGCKPAAKFPVKDFVFGTDQFRNRMKAVKEHRLLEFANGNFRRVGNTWTSRFMGQEAVMTIEPQNVKTVLSLKFEDYGLGLREETLGRLLGKGIFTTDGEPWAHSRAMIRPNFTRSQVADLGAFERHIQTLFKILPTDGSTVDLQELFFKFTIDSATEFLFGQSTGSLNATLKGITTTSANDFAKAFNEAQHSVAQRSRLGPLKRLYRDKAGDDSIRICQEFVDQFVDEAVQYREKLDAGFHDSKEEKYVFLHELAKATTDKRRLRDELLNVLLAGRDTTASLLSNMWFMLAKHPQVFAKLKKEVDETLNGDLPTYETLRNMKYLKYCMNECKPFPPLFVFTIPQRFTNHPRFQ
jgi:cytochrome P450